MIITKQDLQKIKDYLKRDSVKDSQFATASKVDGNTLIPVLQNKKNLTLAVSTLLNYLSSNIDVGSAKMQVEGVEGNTLLELLDSITTLAKAPRGEDGQPVTAETLPYTRTDLNIGNVAEALTYILDGNYVIDSDYVHTDNNFTNLDKSKLGSLTNYNDKEIRDLIAALQTSVAGLPTKKYVDDQVKGIEKGTVDIEDSLESTKRDKALSAYQGKVLKEVILTLYNALANLAFEDNKPALPWSSDSVVVNVSLSLTNCHVLEYFPMRLVKGSSVTVTVEADDGYLLSNITYNLGSDTHEIPVKINPDGLTAKITFESVSDNIVIYIAGTAIKKRSFAVTFPDNEYVEFSNQDTYVTEGDPYDNEVYVKDEYIGVVTIDSVTALMASSQNIEGVSNITVSGNRIHANKVTGAITLGVNTAVHEETAVLSLPSPEQTITVFTVGNTGNIKVPIKGHNFINDLHVAIRLPSGLLGQVFVQNVRAVVVSDNPIPAEDVNAGTLIELECTLLNNADEATCNLAISGTDLTEDVNVPIVVKKQDYNVVIPPIDPNPDPTPDEPTQTTYSVVYRFVNYALTKGVATTTVDAGSQFERTFTPNSYTKQDSTSGNCISNNDIKVTMGGVDITSDAVTDQNGKYTVSIGSVTGNIVIEATASSGVVAVRSNEDVTDAVTIKYKIGDTTNSQTMSLTNGITRIYGIGIITSITFTDAAKAAITSLDFGGCVCTWSRTKTTSGLFASMQLLESVTGLVMKSSTSLKDMFYCCKSLAKLKTIGWDTSNVTDFFAMFRGCKNLANIDVSRLVQSSATTIQSMFYQGSLPVSGFTSWNTSNVNNFSSAFAEINTGNNKIDISSFMFKKGTKVASMFSSSSAITDITVGDTAMPNIEDVAECLFANIKDHYFNIHFTTATPPALLKGEKNWLVYGSLKGQNRYNPINIYIPSSARTAYEAAMNDQNSGWSEVVGQDKITINYE